MQTPSGDLQGQLFSPLTHYILIKSLRKESKWALTGQITHNIAALLFTGRLTFTWKILEIVAQTETESTTSE
jgi:hypothetical protein